MFCGRCYVYYVMANSFLGLKIPNETNNILYKGCWTVVGLSINTLALYLKWVENILWIYMLSIFMAAMALQIYLVEVRCGVKTCSGCYTHYNHSYRRD